MQKHLLAKITATEDETKTKMNNATVGYNITTFAMNSTSIYQNEEFACKNYDLIMNVVVKIVLVGLGCVGNSLSAAVMWKERNTSATAFLLILLAVADTLLLFVWLLSVTFPSKLKLDYSFLKVFLLKNVYNKRIGTLILWGPMGTLNTGTNIVIFN